jgi:hypothetical protein
LIAGAGCCVWVIDESCCGTDSGKMITGDTTGISLGEAAMAAFAKSWRREWSSVMRATIVIVALLLLSIPVRAEPLPMPKPPSGGCPYGYISDGSFCIPLQEGAQEVIPKSYFKTCPYGWVSSGSSFCFRSRGRYR